MASVMESQQRVPSLSMALISASPTPMLLLDDDLVVRGISKSFCSTFQVGPFGVAGQKLSDLGNGEWGVRQLSSLLNATVTGDASVDAYEMDIVRDGRPPMQVVVNAQKLDYVDVVNPRIALAVTDVTAARLAERVKDDLVREKETLLQELQHRVANSLQIIASVMMQSARKVQSTESRGHLHDAHRRVMSIALLQKQLSVTRIGEVALRPYLTDLCESIGASMIDDGGRMTIEAVVDAKVTTTEASVSLGLIVTELVINALKHAFSEQTRGGKIVVGYAAKGAGWTLTVRDNGVGMPGGDDRPKPGLGTGIVAALAKQLGAEVRIEHANPGTSISVGC